MRTFLAVNLYDTRAATNRYFIREESALRRYRLAKPEPMEDIDWGKRLVDPQLYRKQINRTFALMKKTDGNNPGIVYVLTNQAMPGIVKIGMTTRSGIDERMRELFSTGVPVPFECAFACTVAASNCAKIEKAMHTAFAPNRVHASREFFKITPAQAIAILELFDIKQEITEEVNREIDDDLTGEDKASRENLRRRRRPNLNFIEMGIPVGTVLNFGEEPFVEAVVCSEKKVTYNGEEYSLTALTRRLKNLDRNVSPTPFWYLEWKCLADIYEETYPFAREQQVSYRTVLRSYVEVKNYDRPAHEKETARIIVESEC